MNKILIIDDSKAVRKFVSNCVVAVGGEVIGMAEDGEEGLEKFKTLGPDIVLLDVTMPNKDGRTCLREILEIDPRAFVIMLSSINSQEIVDECISLGAKAFLNKVCVVDASVFERELQSLLAHQLLSQTLRSEA